MVGRHVKFEGWHMAFWARHPMLGQLARRAHGLIVLGALFCTLAVKLYIAFRTKQTAEYFQWIATDVAVLLGIELVVAYTCLVWRRRAVIRIFLVFAAVVCTWSVMNAGWLIATGSQILPAVLAPLVRDPLNSLAIVGVNLFYRPIAAAVLLVPSGFALAFFFVVLARPIPAALSKAGFRRKFIVCGVFISAALLVSGIASANTTDSNEGRGLRYNCQLKALQTLFSLRSSNGVTKQLAAASRRLGSFEQTDAGAKSVGTAAASNVVVVVLEGVQPKWISLKQDDNSATPNLASLAAEGVEVANARCAVTHTTKSLFSILTGQFCSVSQDIVEAVPADKAYWSLATVLKARLGYRTAFFQSAKGNFECRPGLASNLGFEKFWARDDLETDEAYVGYLGSDEFAMLEPLTKWIESDQKPFFVTIMCSVTHDPYKVPDWYGRISTEPGERYRQAIRYTDSFIGALDNELERLNLKDNTILCVIGDHGEAFGEHGLFGHSRVCYEEVLRIVWLMRGPGLIEGGSKVLAASSNIDFAPTVLGLLGLDGKQWGLDGVDVLSKRQGATGASAGRRVYFSCWIKNGPCGFVQGHRKVIYDAINELLFEYDLRKDPREQFRKELTGQEAEELVGAITAWRRGTILVPPQAEPGERRVFGRWLCRWNNRKAWAKYLPKGQRQN